MDGTFVSLTLISLKSISRLGRGMEGEGCKTGIHAGKLPKFTVVLSCLK